MDHFIHNRHIDVRYTKRALEMLQMGYLLLLWPSGSGSLRGIRGRGKCDKPYLFPLVGDKIFIRIRWWRISRFIQSRQRNIRLGFASSDITLARLNKSRYPPSPYRINIKYPVTLIFYTDFVYHSKRRNKGVFPREQVGVSKFTYLWYFTCSRGKMNYKLFWRGQSPLCSNSIVLCVELHLSSSPPTSTTEGKEEEDEDEVSRENNNLNTRKGGEKNNNGARDIWDFCSCCQWRIRHQNGPFGSNHG